MTRYLAHRIIMPPGRVLINHIVEVDHEGRLCSLHPVGRELAYTIYVAHPLLLFPAGAWPLVQPLLAGVRTVDDLCALTRRFDPAGAPRQGDPVALVEVLLEQHRHRPLPPYQLDSH